MKRILREFVWIGLSGVVISLGLNTVSPRGLRLSEDYFPRSSPPPTQPAPPATSTTLSSQDATTLPEPAEDEGFKYVREQGLQPISHAEVKALYEDPAYPSGAYVFIDARTRDLYLTGHIPGAYHMERERAKESVESIRPALDQAIKIIVYCSGGNCEDSTFAAIQMQRENVNAMLIYVYPGGMDQWKDRDLPVEKGERGSGDLVKGRTLLGEPHG
ncbi:MAG: rhodanese-like domain-containing protein [Phycisphaerae bacterium]|nr:rhodanese-like domain-containing protein [Phycisphaerae bacterium]